MPYADHMRRALIGRAGDWLARKPWPRATIGLSFAAAAIASYSCALLLEARHVPWVALRILLVSAAAYATVAVVLQCLYPQANSLADVLRMAG